MTKDFESLKKEIHDLLNEKKLQNIDEERISIFGAKFSAALDWHNLGCYELAVDRLERLKFSIATAQPENKRKINIGPFNFDFSLNKISL